MSLKRGVVANYLGQGWAIIMGIAFVPMYIGVLGVEAYGLVGVFAVLQASLAILDLGLTPTLGREMARLRAGAHTIESIRDLLRSLELICIGVAASMIAVTWIGSVPIAELWLKSTNLPVAEIASSIRVMAFVVAARWLEQMYRGALLGLQDHVWLNAAQAASATVRWGGAYLVLIFIAPSITAFFYWQGAVSLLSWMLLVARTYWLLRGAKRSGAFDLAALQKIRNFAVGMSFSGILAFTLMQADKITISKVLPLDKLGYYMLATTFSGGLLQLMAPLNNAVYPRLTEQVTSESGAALERTYLAACEWMSALIVPLALLLAFFSPSVMFLWTGDQQVTLATSTILSLLALGTLCNGLMNLPYMLQLAFGWTALAVRKNILAVVCVVPAMIWAVPRYGAVGAAATWLVLNLSYVIFEPHFMHRKILRHSKWRWYQDVVVLPLIVGCSVALILRWELPVARTRGIAASNIAIAALALFGAVTIALPVVRRSMMHAIRVAVRRGR